MRHRTSFELMKVAGTDVSPKRQLDRLEDEKLEPVRVTSVPPLAGPVAGCTEDKTAGSTNTNDGPVKDSIAFIEIAKLSSPRELAGVRHSISLSEIQSAGTVVLPPNMHTRS